MTDNNSQGVEINNDDSIEDQKYKNKRGRFNKLRHIQKEINDNYSNNETTA